MSRRSIHENASSTASAINRINGGATVEGYDGFWFGFIRNRVNGSVTLNDNVLEDPSPTRSTGA